MCYIKENLEANAFMSLREWVFAIEKEFGFQISKDRLRRTFNRMGITFSRVSTVMRANLNS